MTGSDPLLDGWQPTLIASDIDGTLLNSKDRVIPRLRDAIARATDAGCEVALATGRPFRWINMVLDQLPIRPVCVTSNGAVLFDSRADAVVAAHEISGEAMAEVVDAARFALRDTGGVTLAVERVGRNSQDNPEDVFLIGPGYAHDWEEQGFGSADEADILGRPAVKLLLRNPGMQAPEMYERIAPHVDPERAHLTFSMNAGLIEVAAPGVTKALGVAKLANLHGVAQEETVSFGDMPNDIEMLRWTRLGVAMRNANASVIDAADMVTASNDDGGVADVIERWF